eukprot:5549772-Amphidinium_carterae.1
MLCLARHHHLNEDAQGGKRCAPWVTCFTTNVPKRRNDAQVADLFLSQEWASFSDTLEQGKPCASQCWAEVVHLHDLETSPQHHESDFDSTFGPLCA